MAIHRPKKPRRIVSAMPQSTGKVVMRGANAGARLANKLAKQYEEAQRRAERDRAREAANSNKRIAPRAARATVEETFADTTSGLLGSGSQWTQDALPGMPEEEGFAETLEASAVDLKADDAYGGWDNFTVPEDAVTASEYYSPTNSSYPARPRTREMSYNRQSRTLRVVFRDGGTYNYYDVPASIWYRIKQVRSPGMFLNRNVIGQYRDEKTVA